MSGDVLSACQERVSALLDEQLLSAVNMVNMERQMEYRQVMLRAFEHLLHLANTVPEHSSALACHHHGCVHVCMLEIG